MKIILQDDNAEGSPKTLDWIGGLTRDVLIEWVELVGRHDARKDKV